MLARISTSLREFEEAWLDPVDEPVETILEHTGWRADEPEAYCDRCGESVGESEVVEFGCSSCEGTRPPWTRFARLGVYEALLSDAVLAVKFGRRRSTAAYLGRALGSAVVRAGVFEGSDRSSVAVVAVPMSRLRFLSRGIDHTGAIARGCAQEMGVRVLRPIRARHHASQRSVAASSRASNVRGVYQPRRGGFGGIPDGVRRVVVVDDVVTTGSTARAVCRCVKGIRGDLEVWMASVSVAEGG